MDKKESGRPRTFESDPVEWALSLDPSERLGSRHHTVPVAYLRHFALSERLLVRPRKGGPIQSRNIRDLGIKDFYTILRDDGTPDAGTEQILGVVEGAVAPILDRLINPLLTRRRLDADEMMTLAQFIGFQMVRGAGHRREQELMADYMAKLTVARVDTPGKRRKPGSKRNPSRQSISVKELTRVQVIGHQNEYIRNLGNLAEEMFRHLVDRPAAVVEISGPLFVTCDEPVLVNIEGDHVQHRQECFEAPRERRIRVAREVRKTGEFKQVVHVYPTRPSGVAAAEEVALTLSPRHLLILGERGAPGPNYVCLDKEESNHLARQVNGMLAGQAFDWIAARPDHPSFDQIEVPPVGPLVRVCGGGTPLSEALEVAPNPRRPGRFRKDWP